MSRAVADRVPPWSATGSVRLPEGRRLTYRTAGPRDGFPIFYMHGAVGSPMQRTPELDEFVWGRRIRYLMVNRPGFGGSDPAPGRRIVDFAEDLRTLADALRYERFSVVGVSAGAPYALACGERLEGRIAAVAAVSTTACDRAPHRARGMSRRYRLGLAVLAARPELFTGIGDLLLARLASRPDLVGRVLAGAGTGGERQALEAAGTRAAAARGLLAATERGCGPMVADYMTCCRPWGLRPERIRCPVTLWHGERDSVVPAAAARELGDRIPGAQVRIEPGEGHFFFRRRLDAILGPLTAEAPLPASGPAQHPAPAGEISPPLAVQPP